MAELSAADLLSKYGATPQSPPVQGPGPEPMSPAAQLLAKYGAQADPAQAMKKKIEDPLMKGGMLGNYDPEEVKKRGLLRSTIDELPTIAQTGGAMAGTPLGPIGEVAGAGVGRSAGEQAKGYLYRKLYPEDAKPAPESFSEGARQVLSDAGSGATEQVVGMGVGKALGAVTDKLGALKGKYYDSRFAPTPKANAEEIQAAGERMGVKPTAGMLTSNKELQDVESHLEQSPTYYGNQARQTIGETRKGIQKNAEGFLKDQATRSNYETGDQIKQDIYQNVQEKLMPLKMSYEEMASHSQHIDLNPKSTSRIADGLRKSPLGEFPNLPEGQIIHQYADMIEGAKTVQSLRTLEISAKADIRKAVQSGDGNAVGALSKVVKAVKRAQDNHILRSALESAPTPTQGKNVAGDLIQQMKDTNKGYRALMETIDDIAGNKIKYKGPQGFLDALEDVPSERITEKLWDSRNVDRLQAIQKHLPDQFNMMRQAKIAEIAEKATTGGKVNVNRLIKNLKSFEPETLEMTFGKGASQNLNDLETLYNAHPDMVGPSGTPHGLAILKQFYPTNLVQTLADRQAYQYWSGKQQTGLLKPGLVGPTTKKVLKAGGRTAAGKLGAGLFKGSDDGSEPER